MATRLSLRNRLAIFSAALAASTLAWTLPAVAADPTQQPSGSSLPGTNGTANGADGATVTPGAGTTATDATVDTKHAAGSKSATTADQAGVRELLTSLTVTALSPDASNSITQYFDDAGRNSASGINVETKANNNATSNRPGNANATGAMANGPAAGGPGGPNENLRGGAAAADAAQHVTAKSSVDQSDLNAKIEQFRKDWQAKYNQPFDLKEKEVVFNNETFQVVPGDLSDQARTASEKIPAAAPETPLKQDTDTKTGVGSGSSVSGTNATNTGTNAAASATATDVQPDVHSDTHSATLHVAASHKLPAVDVPLTRGTTAAQWKVSTPASLTQQQLHDNLLKHVTAIDNAKDNWPSDQNDAYRMISHHVLLAVTNAHTSDSDHGDMPMPEK